LFVFVSHPQQVALVLIGVNVSKPIYTLSPHSTFLIEQWPWRSQMSEEQIAWTKALEHKRMELIQALARRDFAEADRLKETIEEMERHARTRGWRLKEH
jgi:hypothetical protein